MSPASPVQRPTMNSTSSAETSGRLLARAVIFFDRAVGPDRDRDGDAVDGAGGGGDAFQRGDLGPGDPTVTGHCHGGLWDARLQAVTDGRRQVIGGFDDRAGDRRQRYVDGSSASPQLVLRNTV
jgi:hypothetical protein